MFCFRIPQQENRDLVEASLRQLKPELLLFLRQLRNMDVQIQAAAGGTVQHSLSLRRVDNEVSGVRHTTLEHRTTLPKPKAVSETFIVVQRTAFKMPTEVKRHGVHDSDVLIAFPIDAQSRPTTKDRLTFNFLPIRSYGLPVCCSMPLLIPDVILLTSIK